jgi:hypothetical protein
MNGTEGATPQLDAFISWLNTVLDKGQGTRETHHRYYAPLVRPTICWILL